ncbi:MAG: lipo-like protein [Hyphomicrobiaceae bacterium]|nr:lipo-like protein [Hyphomicrobiaceae bacterium]
MTAIDRVLDRIGRFIASRLEAQSSGYEPFTPSDPDTLRRVLKVGDVLLVEGNQKVGAAIKYLTQSTWSHAALYVGDLAAPPAEGKEKCMLVEANLGEGVVATPLSRYATFNTRICRPVGLTSDELRDVALFSIARIGNTYDTRHIVDLARYLFPTPPVPVRWRRRMIALGSGEPSRVICSTLIAQAFQSLRYPILPRIDRVPDQKFASSEYSQSEILHIRHHSLFTPRDFDLSPYFQVVKPTIEAGFDPHALTWADDLDGGSCELATQSRDEIVPKSADAGSPV